MLGRFTASLPRHPAIHAAQLGSMALSDSDRGRPYQLTPLPVFGVEARGIDLKQALPDEVVQMIKDDVTRHRLVVFKDQGVVSGQRQVEISRYFGELESTFYKHPMSPHPDVFRVSNDPAQGCTGVGRTGWHVDGSFQPAPFSHALYHIVSVPRSGDTRFAPLAEIVAELPPEMRARWERAWMLSDRRSVNAKPLIYSHPATGLDTLCFHLGMTAAFLLDPGSPRERVSSAGETAALLREVEERFVRASRHLVYEHKWQAGDFIISDNAAVAHEASEGTQAPPEQVGLRVMHRTTVQGTTPPRKAYSLDERGYRIQGQGGSAASQPAA